ncbi:hypothetical protein VE00_06872 [Pseudogymnoascus sp. WSF 3629]|nr:hypothetical protein VE00_06872 [Pseudogymnoascus sp. WSF 3629]
MEGAIELPGEAAPLTPQEVLMALKSASSHQQNLIRSGTQQMQAWEGRPGYYSLLQSAFLDTSLPTDIRYLAVIQLKNGMDKYWRKGVAKCIQKAEKEEMRSKLLEGGMAEANVQLALQNALVISKIARIEYPNDWPDVLTSLIALMRVASESNQLRLQRGLLILLQVVKELASARLRKSQTALQSVTPEIVFFLSNIYTQKVNQWYGFLTSGGDDEGGAMDAMDSSLLALKILRRLLIAGYKYPAHDKDVQELWGHSQLQFGQLFGMISHEPPLISSPAKDLVEKHLLQLSKLHLEMAKTHASSFAALPNSVELARGYWSLIEKYGEAYGSSTFTSKTDADADDEDGRHVLEKLALKGLSLLRSCLQMVFRPKLSFVYRSAEIKEAEKGLIDVIKFQLLTDELVSQMASVIVTKFFIFRQADLEAWNEDPYEWEIREDAGGDGWEFEVRPCSEKLFMDLVINYKHLLAQPLLSFFQSVTGTDNGDIVAKDSVYTAMGIAAPVLSDSFDFDSFLASTLVNDVHKTSPEYKVLRRRIAILIGQWVTIKISVANRPLVYEIFKHLLNPADSVNDQVVRVTAARHLKSAVDDFSFEIEPFLPFAEEFLHRLMGLIRELSHAETQLAVLETIRVIFIRLELQATPFADEIVSLLPDLWTASGEEHLMKQAILTLLTNIVMATKMHSVRYHPLIVPLIQRAVEHGSEMAVYLLEEALDLWRSMLEQTPAAESGPVIPLVDSIFPLLEIGSDSLSVVLGILESYVLLAPEVMLADTTRLRVLSYMTSALEIEKRDLVGLVISIVENMIRQAEILGGTNGVVAVAKDLVESGFMEKILTGLHEAWEAHQTTGPNRRYPKISDVVETDYFTIIARLAITDPATFIGTISSVGPLKSVWGWLSTEWFLHFDSMANPHRQKLSCLALTRLLELPPPMTGLVLQKLQDYFAMWSSVIAELLDGWGEGREALVWSEETPQETKEWDSMEDGRKKVLERTDPVHTIHAHQFTKERLGGLVQNSGGEEAFQRDWLVNVDGDIVKAFQKLGQTQVETD